MNSDCELTLYRATLSEAQHLQKDTFPAGSHNFNCRGLEHGLPSRCILTPQIIVEDVLVLFLLQSFHPRDDNGRQT